MKNPVPASSKYNPVVAYQQARRSENGDTVDIGYVGLQLLQ